MKFQNPSFKIFLNGRTHGHTDGRTSRKKYAPHFFKVGDINTYPCRRGYPGISYLKSRASPPCLGLASLFKFKLDYSKVFWRPKI